MVKVGRSGIKGINDNAFVRVVREDPVQKNLLYAGTETGLYISFNGGKIMGNNFS